MTVVGESKQASKVACLQAVDVLQRRNPLGLKALSGGGCRELGEAVRLRAPCVTSPRRLMAFSAQSQASVDLRCAFVNGTVGSARFVRCVRRSTAEVHRYRAHRSLQGRCMETVQASAVTNEVATDRPGATTHSVVSLHCSDSGQGNASKGDICA